MPSLDEWLRRISGNSWRAIEMGLERVSRVHQNMGSPKPAERSVVIAGTNGKGSTQAMLRAGLEAAGLRTGTFSSPHLLRFNERIRIAGRLASDAELCASFERITERQGGIRLTYFEYAALAALDLMSRADLDVALLEIGMGGRLDAVNIIDADISVITSISLDHTRWLGDTREVIAVEKAGVMRPGRPVICAEVDAPAALFSEAERIGARTERNGVDFALSPGADGVLTWCGGVSLDAPELHPEACAAALRVLERLGVPLSDAVLHAVSSASLPGRCERRSWCGR
ncbi:MAG: bifunctional folylpolyglutamate synthase/dihydrofolate synthase, partial [Gammaproteobacteria bacterium AqS3]|nr:bifunctional folylpolyglutamate synthase/dihydrofolate synthase [Gammaproteobacteria bacterium AqS3]